MTAAHAGARRRKSVALHVVILCASIVVALAVVDVVLILTQTPAYRPIWEVGGVFRVDRDLLYSLVPGERRVWRTSEFTEEASINSLGLRGKELRERGTVERRIVVTGDSVVFGHGVGDREAFPQQLETIFRAGGRNLEVLNAGVKGYGTDQSFKYVKLRLLPLHPDVLVFSVNANDVVDNIRAPLYTIADGRLVALEATHGSLFQVLWLEAHLPRAIRRSDPYRRLVSRMLQIDWYGVIPGRDPGHRTAWSSDKIRLEIEDLRDTSRKRGFRLIVLGLPAATPNALAWLTARLPAGVAFINANSDPSWSREASRWFLADRFHLTVAGNEKLARELHRYLLDEGL